MKTSHCQKPFLSSTNRLEYAVRSESVPSQKKNRRTRRHTLRTAIKAGGRGAGRKKTKEGRSKGGTGNGEEERNASETRLMHISVGADDTRGA